MPKADPRNKNACFGTYPDGDAQTQAERDCVHCQYGVGCAQITPRAAVKAPAVGRKFDTDKPDYTLLPWDAVEEIVKVMDFGANKYARDNWKHVEGADTRYLAAAFRHLSAYAQNEDVDAETGISHLAHAACCMLFMISINKGTK